MTSALIGHTGFVGSNLLRSHDFDDYYNTENIDRLDGRSYDLLVCAAGRADSFRINQHPEADRLELDELADHVLAARADRIVHISTVCIYPWGGAPDEGTVPGQGDLTPYGQNRLRFEQRIGASARALVVRLPQLFGMGIKKGILYDLANHYRVEHIVPHREFQYFDLTGLWSLITSALEAELRVLNVATEPIRNEEVAKDCFGIDIVDQVPPEPESPFATRYTRNMTTCHAALTGHTGPYLWSKDELKGRIRDFASNLAPANGPAE